MSEPLPCPFCNGRASLESYQAMDHTRSEIAKVWCASVRCVNRCVERSSVGTPLESERTIIKAAMDMWNTRADHLASSGPAGEGIRQLNINKGDFVRANELIAVCRAVGIRVLGDAVADDGMESDARLTEARQECEAQKARAIRAESERQDAYILNAKNISEMQGEIETLTARAIRAEALLFGPQDVADLKSIVAQRDAARTDVRKLIFAIDQFRKSFMDDEAKNRLVDALFSISVRFYDGDKPFSAPAPDHAKGEGQ